MDHHIGTRPRTKNKTGFRNWQSDSFNYLTLTETSACLLVISDKTCWFNRLSGVSQWRYCQSSKDPPCARWLERGDLIREMGAYRYVYRLDQLGVDVVKEEEK